MFGFETEVLIFEHNRIATSPHTDDRLLISIKENIDVDVVHNIDVPDIVDYYGRNIYFLSMQAQSRVILTNTPFIDRYTKAKNKYGDVEQYANIDKYGRDIGYYIKMDTRASMDSSRRDIYGNTPLMYKLLMNDMFLTSVLTSSWMMHTSHLYTLNVLTEANNDGIMPITMFDTMDVFKLEGVEHYLRVQDSLGRTALHRLVMIHVGFFMYTGDDGKMIAKISPKYKDFGDRLEVLRPHFDFTIRDIYGNTAEDYYKPLQRLYGNFLAILFDRDQWFKGMKYAFHTPIVRGYINAVKAVYNPW
jgi:hypothetical protein